MSVSATSIDPMSFNFVPNNQVKAHIFDTLIYVDTHVQLSPSLAESWTPIDATKWEFRVSPGVAFHDGTPLTVEDVMFSIDRADKVPNSPASSFAMLTKTIAGIEITGPLKLRVYTREADAYMPRNPAALSIQAKHAVAGRKSEDFNSGVAATDTGPNRFVNWSFGQPVVLTWNDAYWGPKPDWAPKPRAMALTIGRK